MITVIDVASLRCPILSTFFDGTPASIARVDHMLGEKTIERFRGGYLVDGLRLKPDNYLVSAFGRYFVMDKQEYSRHFFQEVNK